MKRKGFQNLIVVFPLAAAILALSAVARAGDQPGAGAAAPAATDYTIRLANGDLGPAFPGAEGQRAALCAKSPLPAAGRVHVLLQLDHIPTDAEKEDWAGRDMRLERYIPNFAWMVSIPASLAGELPEKPGVRFVKRWEPSDRVASPLASGMVGPWAKDEATGLIHVMLHLQKDAPMDEGQRLVEGVGGLPVYAFEGDHAWACWIQPETLGSLAGSESVYWIEEYPPPLDEMNNHARADLNVTAVAAAPYSLTGSGVNVFVYDGGRARPTHEKLTGHITSIDAAGTADHSTHVACTVAGSSGVGQANATGMAPSAWILTAAFAPGAGVLFYDSYGDMITDYSAARNDGTHPADMATNSIGSNVAANGYACTYEGKYGQSSRMIDRIIRGDESGISGTYKRYIVTWAAGNERTSGTTRSGQCGGAYSTLPPPASAKNPITVGAVNADYDSMADFSSWGPTEVGRLKPVVVGPGCETDDYHITGSVGLYSAINTSDTAYGVMCGTSMATPAVAGAVALLLQRYHQIRGNTEEPWNSLVKAILIQTAKDLGPVGPDYQYGYGRVDIKAAVDLMNAHNSGDASAYYHDVLTDTPSGVSAGDDRTWSVVIPSDTKEFKVSLAWDDYFSEAGTTGALVNNLDLELRSPTDTVYYPWSLTPASPWLPATTTAANTLDNMEQVVVSNPAAGTWTIHVRGTAVPQGPQTFGLAYTYTANPHWVCTIPVDYSPAARNGGFESAPSGSDWTLSTSAARDNTQFHSGSYSLKLGGVVNANDWAYQTITIPADATRANVSMWWRCSTADNWSGYDFHFVQITNTSATTLGFVDIYHNGVMVNNSGGFYTSRWLLQDNMDLLPWKGQTIRLYFHGTGDSADATTYWVDDVRVEICTPFVCASPGSPSITSITDNQTCVQNGIRVNFTSGSGATRHDLYKDAAVAVTGYTTGTLYNPGDSASHTYTVRAVNTVASCYTESAGSAFADAVCAAPGEVDPGSTSGTAQYWSADKATHQWHTVAGTVDGYRLYRGVLADLPNLIGGGTDSCTRYQGTGTSQNVSTDNPASVTGRFYWYLVDAYNGAGSGPAGNATAGARTLNTSGACP